MKSVNYKIAQCDFLVSLLILYSDGKQSHKQELETQKKGDDGSMATRKTVRTPAKTMTWMKQMDEGKWKWLGCDLWQGVQNQCQLLWMGNRCWVSEKKKEFLFFCNHHPRIINCMQAFWWGWRKPQGTWLALQCAGGQQKHRRGENVSEYNVEQVDLQVKWKKWQL